MLHRYASPVTRVVLLTAVTAALALGAHPAAAQPTVNGDISFQNGGEGYVTAAPRASGVGGDTAPEAKRILFYADDANQTLYVGVRGALPTGSDDGLALWLNFQELDGADAGTVGWRRAEQGARPACDCIPEPCRIRTPSVMPHAPSRLLALAALLVAPLVAAPAAWAQGTAPPDSDNDGGFEVSTTNHLIYLSQNGNADFTADYEQTADISFPADETTFDWNGDGTVDGNGTSGFKPIGSLFGAFGGTYDGGGHTIENLYIDRTDVKNGLFGDADAIIKNLGLIDVDITGGGQTGALAGENNGTIGNCYTTGSVALSSSEKYPGGGLVGWNNGGTIKNSYSRVGVSVGDDLGGLVETNYQGTIEYSYSTGSVSQVERDFGGLVGYEYNGTVTNSFWDTETSGQDNSAGGTGKTTAEMKSKTTFTDAGWDFAGETANGTADHWDIVGFANNGYPHLTVLTGPFRPFITTWTTTSPNEEVSVGTFITGTDYDFTIEWGDGTPVQTFSGAAPNVIHTYDAAGTYTVKIQGTFPAFYAKGGTASKLQSIEQWGSIAWERLASAFRDATNVTYNASDTPDLSGVTNMSKMFERATNFNGDIGDWDVSGVTDMSRMFFEAEHFNQDIGAWDVSSVTTMNRMFIRAERFNQDIGGWDVSSVTNMNFMFTGAVAFNRDIGEWDVSNVTNMVGVFSGATAFNQDLSSWDVSEVRGLDFPGDGFLENTALSRANYDALLNGWSQLTLQDNLTLDVGGTNYSPSAGPARNTIASTYSWTINDGVRAAALTITGQDGTGNDVGWRMMSFPQDITLGDIENNFSFNFQDVTSGAVVYSWDDSAQSWTPVDTDAEPIAAGEGVIIYFFDDSDDPITSSGFSFSVPGTDSPDTDFSRSGLDNSGRFLMLGNPYLRPYDLSSLDLTVNNGFQQTVQVWDPDQDAFVPRDRSMDETVAGMQGFFAERSTSGEGTNSLTFSAGGTQAGGLGTFIGKSAVDTIQTAPVELALTVTASGGDTLSSDRVTVRFDERAAPGWDAYEATKLPLPEPDGSATLTSPIEQAGALTRRRLAAEPFPSGDEAAPVPFPSGDEAAPVPFPSGDEAAPVPLSARSMGATGTATLRLLDAPGGAGVLELTDTDADTTVDLRSADYTFALSAGDGKIGTPDEARFRLQATSASLPVELADFTAERDERAAVLRWRTASETGNAGFAVQHRRPGAQGNAAWTQVGFVEGGGTTSNPQSYRFRTERLAAGTHRFRLKQVDTDGSTFFSESVSVQIGPAGTYSLTAPAPNPTAGDAHVQLTVRETQPVRVAVYDVLGRRVGIVFEGTLSAKTPQTISVGRTLPAGTYFLRARGEHFGATERLTVVR